MAHTSERMEGVPDHPMMLTFPEGEYFKGLIVIKAAELVEKTNSATILS